MCSVSAHFAQCVRTLRRLATNCPNVALKTIIDAVEWIGNRPYGPASALKQYIKNVGWTLERDGK